MKNVYVISGLGVDERVFRDIDFGDVTPIFLKWVTPEKSESIEDYARRLRSQIKSERPVLIGLSFGGMMAIEIAQQIEPEKIILIASAKSRKEIPWYWKLAGIMNFHKLIPTATLKSVNALSYWFFGVKSHEDKMLLKQIFTETDGVFLRWAIDRLLKWKNSSIPQNAYHIHGSSDRLLPIRFVSIDRKVDGGGHFMTVTHAEKCSLVIQESLRKVWAE